MKKDSKNPWLYRFIRPIAYGLMKVIYRPQIIGRKYLDEATASGACVIAGNHKHALDPLLVDMGTKRTVHTLAKKDLHDGAFGWLFRGIGSIPVDLRAAHNKAALETAVDYLTQGELINVSPEAKRNFTQEILLPFKYGAVTMAKRTGCRVLPYAIVGDYKFRSKNLRIIYSEPMDFSEMTVEEANQALYHRIKSLLLDNRPGGRVYETRPTLEYPEGSLYEQWENSARKHPLLDCMNYFGRRTTYGAMENYIEQVARSFRAIGVKKGDVISICMPNTPEAVAAFYAANKLGAVASMIHPLSGENEIRDYINRANSKVLLVVDLALPKIVKTAGDTLLEHILYVAPSQSMPPVLKLGYRLTKQKKLPATDSRYISWNRFLQGGRTIKDSTITGEITRGSSVTEDTAVLLYSGGTSGIPKGIALTNRNFTALAMQGVEACGCIGEGDKVLAIMPVFHGFGLGICIHTVQYMGGCSVLRPSFSADTFDELLKKYKPNVIAGVPTLYEAMLKNKRLQKVDLSFLRCVISGGDALSVSLKRKIDDFLHEHGAMIQVREGYGLTECVTGSCLMPYAEYREGSIGLAYPDTHYKIVKPDTTTPLPYGEEGEICLVGPTVMKEYSGSPEETALALRMHEDGRVWLHTGDLGTMDEDGYIYFKQRLKRMIVSSGYNVYPQYIENILDSHPAVLMSCVIGIPHPYKIQVAKAFIVLRNGYAPGEDILAELKKLCEENLPRYSWPKEYEFREELPKTLVGKVAYTKLEEEEKQRA